jgi:hypothetical protein
MPQDLGKMVDDIAAWATARITAYADASKTTMTKMMDTSYTGDDLSADLAAAWARLAEDVTSFMKVIPGVPDVPAPGGGDPDPGGGGGNG